MFSSGGLVPCAAAAQASQPLTLEECIRRAQAAQSSVSLAEQETEVARSGLNRARAAFLPQFFWNNTFTYNSPLASNRSEFSFVALNGVREYVSLLTAVQEIDTSGKLRAESQRARADRDAASANLKIARRDLRREVSAGFFRLLLSRHLVKVARDALTEAQGFEKRTRLMADKGEAALADVYKASAQVAFLDQTLKAAELEAQVANHELASFWTSAVDESLEVVDLLERTLPAPEPAAGGLRSGGPLFLQRPEFNLLDAQRQGFLADSLRARAEMLPQANFAFQYGIDSLQLHIRDRGYAAFVNLNVPIFDWLRARNLSREFRLRVKQVESSREIVTRRFSREYEDALARVKSLYQQISITQQQVKMSEEGLRLSHLRYEGGEGLALDVVAAQSQLAQARSNYYTALAAYLNARADLEVAAGQ
jgi:outer membrane protein TolC